MRALTLLDIVIALAAVGAALIAGSFFAFSTFVMRALGALPAPQGVAAMQSINVVVINPLFLGAFMGTAGGCLALAVVALARGPDPRAGWWLAGAALYLLGTFLFTLVFHVPRNNALAAVEPTSAEAARLWATYVVTWTMGNHVRAAAALLASAAFALALRARG
jgi:uncharacterized membrane protein